jgi:hypothetical protein
MPQHHDNMQALSEVLRQARGATQELTGQLRKLNRAGSSVRKQVQEVCAGGT